MNPTNHNISENAVTEEIIKYLVTEKGYPRNCILVEERIKFGKKLIIPDIIIIDKSGKNYIGLIEIKVELSDANKVQAMAQMITYSNYLGASIPLYLITPSKETFNVFLFTEKKEWTDVSFKEFATYEYLEKLYLRRIAFKELENRLSEDKDIVINKTWSMIGLGITIAGLVTSILVTMFFSQFDFSFSDRNDKEIKNIIIENNEFLQDQITLNKMMQDSLMLHKKNICYCISEDSIGGENMVQIEILKIYLNHKIANKQKQIDSLKIKLDNLNTYFKYDLEKAFTPKLLDAKFEKIETKLDYEIKLVGKDLKRIENMLMLLVSLLITIFAGMAVNFIRNIKSKK